MAVMPDKPLDVAEIQMRHKRNEGMCAECEQDWPCEAVRLCAEVERLQAVVDGVRELIADDHMFPTSDDAAWGVVTHHWDRVIAALAAVDQGNRR
jgi:hypothetical protein